MDRPLIILQFGIYFLLAARGGVEAIGFDLQPPAQYLYSCPPAGSWYVQGNVTLTEADLEIFSTNLTIKVNGLETCTIDLMTCPDISRQQTSLMTSSPVALPAETCVCLRRYGQDVYNVYARRLLNTSHVGEMVQAVVPALPKFFPVESTHNLGPIAAEIKGNITLQIDDENVVAMKNIQNISVCSKEPVKITVCAPNSQLGTVLKLRERQQTTLTNSTSCVYDIEYFDFTHTDTHQVVFTLDEGAGCAYQDRYIINVKEDNAVCTSMPTTTIAPTQHPSTCSKTDTSKPRQIAILNNNLQVMCDTETSGGDWIMIQRRITGDVNFNQGWDDCVAGFGQVTGDHWLGLQNMHTLCHPRKPCTLRIEVKDTTVSNDTLWAEYKDFSLGGYTENYKLNIGSYSGTAGDGLTTHSKGRAFSTFDRDNDSSSQHCADNEKNGPWWYGSCGYSDLNGKWGDTSATWLGLSWYGPPLNRYLHATFTEMKVRLHA